MRDKGGNWRRDKYKCEPGNRVKTEVRMRMVAVILWESESGFIGQDRTVFVSKEFDFGI